MEIDLSLLKIILNSKKHAIDFAASYEAEMFHSDYWQFSKIILNHIRGFKEIPTLSVLLDKFQTNNQLCSSLSSTWEKIDSVSAPEQEFAFLLEKAKTRMKEADIERVKSSLALQELGKMDITKTISELQRTINHIKSLDTKKSYEQKSIKDALPEFKELYNAKKINPNLGKGIETGYHFIDEATGGLRAGELLMIGGESGAGKSLLLMNLAINMFLKENKVFGDSFDFKNPAFLPGNDILYFSLEMPYQACLNRFLSSIAGVQSKKLRKANLEGEDLALLRRSMKFIQAYPNQFELVDAPRGVTIEKIEEMFEDAKSRCDPKIVVIDYLNLMDYTGPEQDDWLKLGKISEKVHEFARVHNVIVLSATQLNRVKPAKDMEDAIGLHRIGRSALIATNCNQFLQITSKAKDPDMDVAIIKNRDGEQLRGKLLKDSKCGRLIDSQESGDMEFFDVDDISEVAELLEID